MQAGHRFSFHSNLAVLVAAMALAACGSSVKLDETPQQPAQTAQTSASNDTLRPPAAGNPGAQTQAAASRDVAKVDVAANPNAQAGPPSAGRVIYFDYDSFAIKPEFQSVIDAHARYMAANPGRRMAIEGHTDERGGREYNLALGQKRSEAVQSALRLLGVKDNQSEPVSFGKEKPASTGASEEAWSRNRRAEIVYR
jgi:peptidoglycan-associated lipoprotein